jgi:hypothetical protein
MDGFSVRRVVQRTRELVVHVLADRIFLVEAVHPHPPDRALVDDYHMLGHIGPIPAAAIRTLSEPSVTFYAKCGRQHRDIFVEGRRIAWPMAEATAGGRDKLVRNCFSFEFSIGRLTASQWIPKRPK